MSTSLPAGCVACAATVEHIAMGFLVPWLCVVSSLEV